MTLNKNTVMQVKYVAGSSEGEKCFVKVSILVTNKLTIVYLSLTVLIPSLVCHRCHQQSGIHHHQDINHNQQSTANIVIEDHENKQWMQC